jgi:predicted amino acid dehydrogenase/acetylornithine/succinyldiaminopimelate/putrescine aminotransferase
MDKDILLNLQANPSTKCLLPENYFHQYAKPSLANLLRLLKLDKNYYKASEEFLYFKDERNQDCKVIDLLSGYGSLIFGHNPSFLKTEMTKLIETDVPVYSELSIAFKTGLLAEKLNSIIRDEAPHHFAKPYMVHITRSETETFDLVFNHALIFWNRRKDEVVINLKKLRNKYLLNSHVESPETAEEIMARIENYIGRIELAQPKFTMLAGSQVIGASKEAPVTVIMRNSNPEEIRAEIQKNSLINEFGICFSNIAGFFIEPLPSAEDIYELSEAVAIAIRKATLSNQIPLIANEIHTGLFRSGRFLSLYHYGINPDYILLGKSLGGGLAKISALMIEKSYYVHEFSRWPGTSLADDEWNAHIAFKNLEELIRLRSEIIAKAEEFEASLRERVLLIQMRYPNVIKNIQGKGLIMEIEIDYTLNQAGPVILDAFHQSGYMPFIFSSFLLNNYGIRIGTHLGATNCLRFEAPACLSVQSLRQFLNAIEDLCRKLYHGQIFALTEHLWNDTQHPNGFSVISKEIKKKVKVQKQIPRLAFLTHLINENHLRKFDPVFENMSAKDCRKFIYEYGPHIKMLNYHEQIIEGVNGNKIQLNLFGSVLPSLFFENSLRLKDLKALKIIQDIVTQVQNSGARLIGLGQYTSIITEGGTLISSKNLGITTGNSLTAAYGLEGIFKILNERGQNLSDLKVAVIGAAGNVCNVMAQILADKAKELHLFYREHSENNSKIQMAKNLILANSSISINQLSYSSDLSQVKACDVVLIGTNSSKTILYPQHLKNNAIVLDISVPSNIDRSVFKDRPDVRCFVGGLARMPLQQSLDLQSFPTPKGEVFACMAETMALGLNKKFDHYSLGPLSKSQVLDSKRLAELSGFELGSLKRNPTL